MDLQDQVKAATESLRIEKAAAQSAREMHRSKEQGLKEKAWQAQQESELKLLEVRKQCEQERIMQEERYVNCKHELNGMIESHASEIKTMQLKLFNVQREFYQKLQTQEEAWRVELARKDVELQQKGERLEAKVLELAKKLKSEGHGGEPGSPLIDRIDEIAWDTEARPEGAV
ncbi:hypothetical protein AAFF_G00356250 [Aldrovandia affinis]|uniref:Uncharacterized protein n=1 Tax=Aldrovandia affinis TaxID=143900 RepID=A0AAD7X0T9_9TELE|nr:hypothetical protein AAFF_G00356250 [Aldrovandia affinis]